LIIVLDEWHPTPEVLQILSLARDFAEREQPVTVRQTFYHLVSVGAIPNTEPAYRRLVRVLIRARKSGIIPFDWFVDPSRHPLKLKLYRNVGEFLTEELEHYYRDTWNTQDTYVIVWIEKQAVQRPLWPVVGKYNVSLYPGRGYSSWPLFLQAVEELEEHSEKNLVMLYLGDYDPSGVDISRDLKRRFEEWGVELAAFTRLALTRNQIEEYELPPMPAKRGDPRYANFVMSHGDFAVELDALPPRVLRELVDNAILRCLDVQVFREEVAKEQSEKAWLREKVQELKDAFDAS